MPTIGSQTAAVHGAKGSFERGSTVYGLCQNVEFSWTWTNDQEDVLNSFVPIRHASSWRGRISGELITSTDEDLYKMHDISGNMISSVDNLTLKTLASTTFTVKEIDTALTAVTKTWTDRAVVTEFGNRIRRGGFIVTAFAGDLIDIPTVA